MALDFTSSAPCPQHPNRLSISRCKSPSRSDFTSELTKFLSKSVDLKQFQRSPIRVWQFDLHRQSHSINFVLILRLVLSKWTVTLQEFVDHAAKAKPIGTAVVAHAFAENLGRHVTMSSDTRVWLLFTVEK